MTSCLPSPVVTISNAAAASLPSLRRRSGALPAARTSRNGELAVTAPVVFGRLHVLPDHDRVPRQFPRVTTRLLLVDRVVDLIEEGLDVALRIGALPDSSLDRDSGRRYPPCQLRQPRLSRRARRAIFAA